VLIVHFRQYAILTNLVADTATFPMQSKLFNLDYRLWRITIVNNVEQRRVAKTNVPGKLWERACLKADDEESLFSKELSS
jgi:hypothetical protein